MAKKKSNKKTLIILGGLGAAGAVAAGILLYPPVSGYGQPSMSIVANPTSGAAPLTVAFNGQYLDATGKGIGGATIYLFINGAQQGTTTTSALGSYSVSYTFQAGGNFQVDVSDNVGNG